VICSSEMSFEFHPTLCHNVPEDRTLYTHSLSVTFKLEYYLLEQSSLHAQNDLQAMKTGNHRLLLHHGNHLWVLSNHVREGGNQGTVSFLAAFSPSLYLSALMSPNPVFFSHILSRFCFLETFSIHYFKIILHFT
jgi:hypothetical protein